MFLTRLLRLLLLLSLQIIVLNHIHILGYITPLLIGYMVVCLRHGTGRIAALLWGFATGLLFDVFSDTAGMASAAMTLAAMVQQPLLDKFIPRDAPEHTAPSFHTIGTFSYIFYTFLLMLIIHAAFYLLDAFTLSNWQLTLISIGGSTLLATLLSILADMVTKQRRHADK